MNDQNSSPRSPPALMTNGETPNAPSLSMAFDRSQSLYNTQIVQ